MDDLISRKSLYDKMREAEELARQRVLDTRTSFPDGSLNPAYVRYMAQLSERTRFKEMIYDEPSAERDYKFDEWCTECKEYDKEKHCCPRFNQVIRTTLQEVQENRKKGKLLNANPVGECSVCGWLIDYRDEFNFCPKCGSDLRGEKDEKL